MQVLIDELKRSVSEVPLSHVPILLGVLGTLTAQAQLRLMMAGPEPVSRETEDLLTVPEVAKRLKLSTDTVYELCRQGKIQSNKCGRTVRIEPSAVAEYLAEQRP